VSSLHGEIALWIDVLWEEAVCLLFQADKTCRMNCHLQLSRVMCTFAKYSQSLKYLSARRCCFYNLPARNLYAAVECNKRTVGNRCYTENITASLNHTRLVPRHWSDKAEDKTEVETAKESSPGLFRRFHQTYKEHGKILMCVHLATSAVWAAVFYCVAVRYELYRQFCVNYNFS